MKSKRIIYKDPRYDAVGSSSLREELFNTFLKGKGSKTAVKQNTADTSAGKESPKGEVADRQERRNKAVKEREEKVNAERRRLDADIERSKQGIDKEEGERLFMCAWTFYVQDHFYGTHHIQLSFSYRTLLTDAIREPQVRRL